MAGEISRVVQIRIDEEDGETGLSLSREIIGEIVSSEYSPSQILDTLITVLEELDIVVKVG